ncbi:hypothetical protein RIN58_09715 [Siccibacter colletis]|uniref:hypothetical protein n=1 Tax=Siccibacter colletis TaxID=1505757 RepID=UPI0028BE06E0|nr:hypothetical protein [Siccibacter colletis]WNN50343.1 hypothetical protein RIN58_09715 [Siccibacter colletis]
MSIKIAVVKSLLLSVLFVSTATFAANGKMRIRSVFDINKSFCAIKTNGVLGMDNRDSALEGEGLGTSSTNALLVLENGINDITLEIGALGWFSGEKKNKEELERFDPDSYCKLALTLFSGEDRKTITRMKVTINNKGIPQVSEEDTDGNKVNVKKILARQVEKGHFDKDYFNENYYPAGMTVYQFTQKVYLKGLPEWRWVKATPFTGKPEQIQALKNAYAELWRLFSAKDNEAIKNNMKYLLNAWATATDSNVDDIYNSHQFVEGFKNKGFRMIPINWNDYQVEVMNKGRLVRFVNKSDPTVYPLSNYFTDDDGDIGIESFTPIFSLVEGTFIPVI